MNLCYSISDWFFVHGFCTHSGSAGGVNTFFVYHHNTQRTSTTLFVDDLFVRRVPEIAP
jgi:hypothetical protein